MAGNGSCAGFAVLLQFTDSGRISRVAVNIEYAWRDLSYAQRKSQQALRRDQIPVRRQRNSIVSPRESMARYR